ncbi:hypothetical protein ACFQ0R_06365 [Psychroflexus salinarum]|uniref:Uncharacterized protein n=1 Tax=Psychroflexus salinarum TaxID=546024 RepID=A0ABW3GNN6_9FLAO
MKKLIILSVFICVSCVSIPNETIRLSETLGNDLQVLKQSHVSTISIYYADLESKINRFIDEVYSPFIIQYVLESEFQSFENGNVSIITSLKEASKAEATQKDTEKALQDMVDFQIYATQQIAQKRNELLQPIQTEKLSILKSINSSYDNAIAANATLTGYLKSVKNVEKAQTESLSLIGIDRAEVDESMLRASNSLDELIARGRAIDHTSENARQQMNELIEKIKTITNP